VGDGERSDENGEKIMTSRKDDLESSKRFAPAPSRRDFLGLAAAWSAASAFVLAAVGALRLPMPAVFPESSPRVRLGRPGGFGIGSATYFPSHHVWLFREDRGFHAISSVCTHLGCIVTRTANGAFICPCHGSKFDPAGSVTRGPAPRALAWVELSISPEGALVADRLREVPQGTILENPEGKSPGDA
jgi:cytochrome b6-f complex iron-sulfur subunit